jgi:hypothetical protein
MYLTPSFFVPAYRLESSPPAKQLSSYINVDSPPLPQGSISTRSNYASNSSQILQKPPSSNRRLAQSPPRRAPTPKRPPQDPIPTLHRSPRNLLYVRPVPVLAIPRLPSLRRVTAMGDARCPPESGLLRACLPLSVPVLLA